MPRLPNGHEYSVYTAFNHQLYLLFEDGFETIDLLGSLNDREKFLVDTNVPIHAVKHTPEYAFFFGGTYIQEHSKLSKSLNMASEYNGCIFILQSHTKIEDEQYRVTIEIIPLNNWTDADCLDFPSFDETQELLQALSVDREKEIERLLDIHKSNSMEQLHCDIVNNLPGCRYDAEKSIYVVTALYAWLLHDPTEAEKELKNRNKPGFGGDLRIIYEALLLGMGICSKDPGVKKMANKAGIKVLNL